MGRRPTRGGAPEAGAGWGQLDHRACFGDRWRRADVAGGDGVGGSMDDGFREADGGGEFRGAPQKTAVGRMMAAQEGDTTTTMTVDRGRKSGQVLEGEGQCFIYRPPLQSRSCNQS
jgi:hypothetical protein